MNKAIIFDRDGVINHPVQRENEETAPWKLEEFVLCDGVDEVISGAKQRGFLCLIATNQPGVTDGDMAYRDLLNIIEYLYDNFEFDNIIYSAIRNSNYYKPNNGMLEYLIRTHKLDRSKTFFIGDRWKDVVPGNKSGLTTIYIGDEYWCPKEYEHIKPDYVVNNLLEAYNIIKEIDNV